MNDLLATGASYAMVVRALAADNAELDKCDRVTIDSIRNHTAAATSQSRTSPKQPTERSWNAGQRRTASTSSRAWPPRSRPIAFFETVMVKSYETLVDSDTRVDVNTGIVAAGRLQSLIESRDYSRDIAELRFQLGKIGEAVKSTVPQEMWGDDHREAGGAGAAPGGARRV